MDRKGGKSRPFKPMSKRTKSRRVKEMCEAMSTESIALQEDSSSSHIKHVQNGGGGNLQRTSQPGPQSVVHTETDTQLKRTLAKITIKSQENRKILLEILERLEKLENSLDKTVKIADVDLEEKFKFPIDNDVDFENFLSALLNEEDRKAIIKRLVQVGGKSQGDVVRNLLYKILDKKFARKFTWVGRNNNVAFKELMAGKCVLAVCTHAKQKYQMDEAQVKMYATEWFKHRKDKI